MRRILTISAILFFALSCNEQSFFVDPDNEAGVSQGSVLGRVCDPSGRTWLADAMSYTHLVDKNGKLYDTRIAYTGRDGYYLLDDLPGNKEYTIYVQHGDEQLSQERIYLEAAQDLELDEPDCFDPLELDVAVITGDYDDFQLVLSNMGFANYELIDGLFADDMAAFLLDLDNMLQYDIIFFNGGHVEEGIIYEVAVPGEEGEEGLPEDDEVEEESEEEGDTGGIEEPSEGDTGTPETETEEEVYEYDSEQIVANIRDYVAAGGAIYGSDWAYDVIEIGWPEAVNFVGTDEVPDSAQLGEYGIINAAVSDAALAEWLGSDYTQVEYDLPVWPPIEGVADTVSVHLTGSVSYREGTNVYSLASVPLLVSFTHGDGKVAFSTFRVAKNADSDIVLMLQYMMYSL